jgi:hypothetical protein
MDSRPPDGHTPVRVTPVRDSRHHGAIARVAAGVVDMAIPRLAPDHQTRTFREQARHGDDRLERPAHRLIRRKVNQSFAVGDGPTR